MGLVARDGLHVTFSLCETVQRCVEIQRVRERSVVADLRKDYFLLCRKENLAHRDSANNNNNNNDNDDNNDDRIITTTGAETTTKTTSCSNRLSHVSRSSPTSPCEWNVALSRLRQLDSVFDADPRTHSASDGVTTDDQTKQVIRSCIFVY